jgi:hypothetical protein
VREIKGEGATHIDRQPNSSEAYTALVAAVLFSYALTAREHEHTM